MPAARIIKIGLTLLGNPQMSTAVMKGIQQFMNVIFARTAIFQVGTAISATTAGRMPAKTLATQGTSWKLWKNMAISNIIRNEGKAVPRAQQRAPAVWRFL